MVPVHDQTTTWDMDTNCNVSMPPIKTETFHQTLINENESGKSTIKTYVQEKERDSIDS